MSAVTREGHDRQPWARVRGALVFVLLTFATLPAVASAQDSDAPKGALPHWLPTEQWVYQHWMPFDEARMHRLLGVDRGDVWRHLRDDQVHDLGQLARRRGMTLDEAARRLVAPRLRHVSGATGRLLVRRARRLLTQGHLSQHMLFHSLHQLAIPDRATRIFGTPTKERYLALRRAEVSPLQIGRLFGRSQAAVQRAAAAALRTEAAKGVRTGAVSRRQAAVLLDRQLRQLPRFLGQRRYNGPPQTGPGSRPLLPPFDYASNPSITADGATVVFDAYRATIPEAKALGEIRVLRAATATGATDVVTAPTRLPTSAYNSEVSADGSTVVFEQAPGNLNFAKRYGRMEVVSTGERGLRRLSHQGVRRSRTAYNPSVSADGTRAVFEVSDDGGASGRSLNALLLHDAVTGQRSVIGGGSGYGTVYEPRISGDGRTVVFTSGDADSDGHTLVYVRDVATGATTLVSRADGAQGASADGDAREPAISHDGRLVAFASTARNLGTPSGGSRVYVRDMAAGTTRVVALPVAGPAFDPSLSPDGRWLVAGVRARAGSARATLWRVDLRTGEAVEVTAGDGAAVASEPVVDASGSRVAYTTTARVAGKPPRVPGVVVRDLAAGTQRLLSTHAPIKAGPGAKAKGRGRASAASLASSPHVLCPLAG